MEKTDEFENKAILRKISGMVYLKNWFFAIVLKTLVDLVFGLLLVFTFFAIGYLLENLSFFSEAKLISVIVKKASFVLAYCYLAAILVSTALRIYFLIKSDLISVKKLSRQEVEPTENKPEPEKEGKK